MKKSIEERLTDIESNVTRLTKMQGCVFNVLLLLDRASSLVNKSERAVSFYKVPLESIYQNVNHSLVFMFGAMAFIGVAATMFSLYLTTQDLSYRVAGIVVGIWGLATAIYAVLMHRRASSQIRGVKEKLTQTDESFESFKKEAASLDQALARILAEWRELVPDDLAGESKSED